MDWKKFGVVWILNFIVGTAVLVACQSDTPPSILYLGWDERDRIQLFQIMAGEDASEQLTQATTSILDFAPSPNGEQIAYSTGDELWLMDGNGRNPHNLLACPSPPCDQLIWHPDGRRLLYERQNQLWWLDTETGATIPLQENAAGPSRAARFSADGEWVSYVVSPEQGIEFYNFIDGRHFLIPSILGTPAIWHPTEPMFLYRDRQIVALHDSDDREHLEHSHDYGVAEHLFVADINGRTGLPISGNSIVDDGPPAWSPDGEWIVFGRKPPRTAAGRQLWLARPDGSEARALTDDPLIHHGLPQWSKDGRSILYQRYDTANPETRPGIWLLEIDTGIMTTIAISGFQPTWLP